MIYDNSDKRLVLVCKICNETGGYTYTTDNTKPLYIKGMTTDIDGDIDINNSNAPQKPEKVPWCTICERSDTLIPVQIPFSLHNLNHCSKIINLNMKFLIEDTQNANLYE